MARMLVVGGHTGIGAEVVRQGYPDGWESVVIGPQSGEDVTDMDYIYQLDQHWGPQGFDALVYCAGVTSLEWIGQMREHEMEHVFDVNVMGFIRTIDWLRKRQERCNVVALVSDAMRTPMRGSIAYCASKAALAMAVRVAARELAPGWRVNGIAPTMVAGTPMTEKMDTLISEFRGWSQEHALAYEQSMIPMGRRVTVREVAQLVLEVLDGPEFMSGSIVDITGGK